MKINKTINSFSIFTCIATGNHLKSTSETASQTMASSLNEKSIKKYCVTHRIVESVELSSAEESQVRDPGEHFDETFG